MHCLGRSLLMMATSKICPAPGRGGVVETKRGLAHCDKSINSHGGKAMICLWGQGREKGQVVRAEGSYNLYKSEGNLEPHHSFPWGCVGWGRLIEKGAP